LNTFTPPSEYKYVPLAVVERLTHARAALAVQVAEAAETLLATRTVGQVAFARLRDHALGHDGRAHGLVARVADVRERQQQTDDGDEENVVFHLADNVWPPCPARDSCMGMRADREHHNRSGTIVLLLFLLSPSRPVLSLAPTTTTAPTTAAAVSDVENIVPNDV